MWWVPRNWMLAMYIPLPTMSSEWGGFKQQHIIFHHERYTGLWPRNWWSWHLKCTKPKDLAFCGVHVWMRLLWQIVFCFWTWSLLNLVPGNMTKAATLPLNRALSLSLLIHFSAHTGIYMLKNHRHSIQATICLTFFFSSKYILRSHNRQTRSNKYIKLLMESYE